MVRPITLNSELWTDLSLEDFCRKASALGYDGIEPVCWGGHFSIASAVADPTYAAGIRAMLARYGLTCTNLAAHRIGKCVGDIWEPRINAFAPAELFDEPLEIRAWAIEEMKLAADAAAAMGIDIVTGYMGSPVWRFFYHYPPNLSDSIDEGCLLLKELWDPILDHFDEAGVRFALEVHPTELAYDYYTLQKLFELFDYRTTIGISFNPAHLLWQGIQPELIIRDFPDRIYHVQIMDAAVTLDGRAGILSSHFEPGDLRRGWNFRSPGRGEVNFEAVVRELNAVGYIGSLAVHWEDAAFDRDFGAKDACDFLQAFNYRDGSRR